MVVLRTAVDPSFRMMFMTGGGLEIGWDQITRLESSDSNPASGISREV